MESTALMYYVFHIVRSRIKLTPAPTHPHLIHPEAATLKKFAAHPANCIILDCFV
jgi:hypothetical protein